MMSRLKSLLNAARRPEDDPRQEIRVAAASLLLAMTRADSDVHDVETETVRSALAKLLGLAEAEVEPLIREARESVDESVSLYDFTAVLHRQQTREEKIDLVRELWAVAAADGAIDPQEEYLVRKVANLLYVPHEEFIRAKQEAFGEPGP